MVNWCLLALTIYFNIDNDVMKNFAPYYPSGQVGYVAFYLAIFLIATQLKGKRIKNVESKYGVPNLDSAFNWDMLGNWWLHSYSN